MKKNPLDRLAAGPRPRDRTRRPPPARLRQHHVHRRHRRRGRRRPRPVHQWSARRARAAGDHATCRSGTSIYTHGHYDHAFGTPALFDDAAERGATTAPDVVGHVNVARRFARYRRPRVTSRRPSTCSSRAGAGTAATSCARRATTRRRSRTSTGVSLVARRPARSSCRHGLGETDDHTWVWIPERRVIVGGDFIVSSLPNAGTPFRVQRYVLEWAEALEAMAALDARRDHQRPRRRLHRRRRARCC